MNKFIFAILLTALVCLHASAQTRSTGAAQQQPRTPAARPSPTPPAQTAKPPAAQPGTQTQNPAQTAARTAAANNPTDECGCEAGPLPEVLAVVGGIKLVHADLSPETVERVRNLQRQVIEARRAELDLQINSMLLEAEAKKRGISTSKLLEDEVAFKAVNPTEADAQSYFTQNRARIETQAGRSIEFAELKDNIIAFLRNERQQERADQFAGSLRAANDVKVLVAEPPPPLTPADRARLLATVNGRRITADDIEKGMLPFISAVQQQVYALRRQDIEIKINDMLLTQEAQKRQLTPRALLDVEVGSKTKVITEAEALKFFNENKERINGQFEQIKYQIIQYLEEEQREKLQDEFAGRLRAAAGVRVFLNAPEPPVFEIAVDDQPMKGSRTATVTVVEFTDFQCPSCAALFPVIERLATEMGDRVRFVVRDYPLQRHENAFKAAEAAEAAREQGKYWEYAALLYRNQSALRVENLKQYASALGLDRAKFDAALDSGKFAENIRRDMLDGQKVGLRGTPSFFVNGRLVNDASYETLKAAIEAALAAPARK